MKTIRNGKPAASKALKERYLQCFGARANNAAVLQGVVSDLMAEGIPRQTLVTWAVKGGYSKGYVSSLLSRIFVSLGLRERKKGAGRKPSPAALELLAHARNRYGENFLKVLHAACRAGKAQSAAVHVPNETSQHPSGLIVLAQLDTDRSATIPFRRTFEPAAEVRSKNRRKP